MALDFDWFHENFENIRINDDRRKYLEELQIAVGNLNQSDLSQLASKLQLGIVFDALNTRDTSQLELTIAVVKKFLSALDPRDVIKLYGPLLGRALEHPEIEPKQLVLTELNRATQCPDLLEKICEEIPLLQSVIECIKDENLSLASTAMKFLNELGKIETGIRVLFSSPVLEYLKQTSLIKDTVRFRIYEVVIDISSHSENGLIAAANCQLLTDLLNELQGRDILLQCTGLEMVTKLALTDHGLKFLKEKGLLDYVNSRLKNSTEPLSSLLLPGYIKFFGNIAQVRPQFIFSEYSDAMTLIFQFCSTDDPVLSNVALETIGYIASNPSGKLTLNQYELRMFDVIGIIRQMVLSQTTERKVIALNVLDNILRLKVSSQDELKTHSEFQTPELLTITKRWFCEFSDNPTKTLKDVCEKPFKELKLAGLVVLNTIAEQAWGQDQINKCSGLVEYLLDRNEESDMSCKTAKHRIVKTIFESPSSCSIFSSETMAKFQTHVRQGVIYVQTKTEIALEGAS